MSTNENTFGYWKKLFEQAGTDAQRLLIKNAFVEKFGTKALQEAHFDDADMAALGRRMKAQGGGMAKPSFRREPNPMCDQGDCVNAHGEVRVLPTSSDPYGSNQILCQHCYQHSVIPWRMERNKELSADAHYSLPRWEDLRVYGDE